MKLPPLVPVAVAAALAALYLSYVLTFVEANLLSGATAVELSVFTLQFLKIAVTVSVGRLRTMSFVNIFDLLGAELVAVLPLLIVADISFGVQSAPATASEFLLGWIAGVTTFGAPYGIYRLVRAMEKREALVVVLPSAIFLSELLVLLVAGADTASASGAGFADLPKDMIQAGAGAAVSGARTAGAVSFVPLAVLYVTLLLYALGAGGTEAYLSPRGLAALGLLVTVATFAGAYAAYQEALSLTYFAVPVSIITASVAWWFARG